MVRLVKAILLMTLCFEGVGAILSFIVFVQDYTPLHALGISVFHSIAAFNNSGFDILGGLRNLIPYQTNVLLNMITCFLIIFGGLGFLVYSGYPQTEKVPQAMPAFESCHHDDDCAADNGNPAAESDREYFVDGSLLSQRFGENSRIFPHIRSENLRTPDCLCCVF